MYITLVDYPTTVYPSPVVSIEGVLYYPSIGGLSAYAHAKGIEVSEVLSRTHARDCNVWDLELEERRH